MHSFLGCTVHGFFECKPQSFLLHFHVVKGSHTGTLIADELNAVIEKNGLEQKLKYVVTDNASNMKRAFQVLHDLQTSEGEPVNTVQVILDDEELWNDLEDSEQNSVYDVIDRHTTERLSCYAHSLQLCVKDGLSKLNTSTSVLAKCSKLANLTHQTALFRGSFEEAFGKGRSIPKMNTTRWNSMYHQLSSIASLDSTKLAELLRATEHKNLVFTPREIAMLIELVNILPPFAEATDLLQGDEYPTIGCVVPSVVGLYKCLQTFSTTASYHTALVNALEASLCERFGALLRNVKVLPSDAKTKNNTNFSSNVYLMASALDPNYSLLWLEEDYPGSAETNKTVRDGIMSKLRIH